MERELSVLLIRAGASSASPVTSSTPRSSSGAAQELPNSQGARSLSPASCFSNGGTHYAQYCQHTPVHKWEDDSDSRTMYRSGPITASGKSGQQIKWEMMGNTGNAAEKRSSIILKRS